MARMNSGVFEDAKKMNSELFPPSICQAASGLRGKGVKGSRVGGLGLRV